MHSTKTRENSKIQRVNAVFPSKDEAWGVGGSSVIAKGMQKFPALVAFHRKIHTLSLSLCIFLLLSFTLPVGKGRFRKGSCFVPAADAGVRVLLRDKLYNYITHITNQRNDFSFLCAAECCSAYYV